MDRRGHSATAWLALAIGFAALAAYLPALWGGFVFDDHLLIEDNELLRGPLWAIWRSRDSPDYWPLTMTAFWLQWHLWGAATAGYHVVNLALHIGTALLLWRVLRELSVPGAWLAGLLFAVHPVAVESVAWISEQKNTFSAALFLGAVLVWLRPDPIRPRRTAVAALLLFALALLAKASVVMLPFVLLGTALYRRGKLQRADWIATAPFFSLALIAGAVNVWFQRQNAMAGGWSVSRGALERAGRSGWALASYLQKALVPVRLAFAYPEWPVDAGSPLFYLPLAAALLAVVALWRMRARALSFAFGYHALMVLPVLGFVEIAYFNVAPVADHLQYLALMGPAALVAAALSSASTRWRPAARLASAGLVIAFGASTASRAAALDSDLSLWSAAVRDAPGSGYAHLQLSTVLFEEKRVSEALEHLDATAQLARAPGDAHRYRALWLIQSGRPAEAIAEAITALGEGRDPELRRDAAYVLIVAGSSEAAVPVLQALVKEAPASSDYSYWLAAALSRQGRFPEAVEVLRAFCRRRPGNSNMEQATAFLLTRLGSRAEALEHAAAFLRVSPEDPRAAAQLSEWLARDSRRLR